MSVNALEKSSTSFVVETTESVRESVESRSESAIFWASVPPRLTRSPLSCGSVPKASR